MHVAFFAYGIKDKVDIFLRDVQSQKAVLPFTTTDGKKQKIFIQCQLRVLPFGIYEFVFPREYLGTTLTTLKCNEKTPYVDNYPFLKVGLSTIRKVLGMKKIPKKFDTSEKYLWITEDVSIIPIGYKEDKDITDPINNSIHEGI